MIQHVTHSTESLKTDIKVNKSLIWAHNNPFWGYIQIRQKFELLNDERYR